MPLLTIVVPFGLNAFGVMGGLDASNNPVAVPFSQLSAGLSDADYVNAFVQSSVAFEWVCASKVPPPEGGSTIITVNITGKDVNGNDLPPVQVLVQFNGAAVPPPPPPLTTQIVMPSSGTFGTTPGPDPGVPTVALRLA